jgi:hypothetical protein
MNIGFTAGADGPKEIEDVIPTLFHDFENKEERRCVRNYLCAVVDDRPRVRQQP